MISVLILTLNEEKNIRACLESVSWSDDIVILDSGSTDKTVDIARQYGARIFVRQFDDEKSQREASIRLPFKHQWVFNPDADEIATAELSREMQQTVAAKPIECAFRVRFKNIFMNRWIKRSSLYPTLVVRLFRPEFLSFERSVNLSYIVDGKTGLLNSHFEHFSFNKGMTNWFDKHNKYSQKEAEDSIEHLKNGRLNFRGIIGLEGPVARRKSLKELSFRVPFRPLFRFIYMFFIRLGFLDGIAGFHYCMLLSIYEYMITIKMREIRTEKTMHENRLPG